MSSSTATLHGSAHLRQSVRRKFQPATGPHPGVLRIPDRRGVRWDGGIREGQAVTPAFDSMLAKLDRLRPGPGHHHRSPGEGVLKDPVLLGVPTNIDFLARIMANPVFRAGKLHTGFIPEQAEALKAPAPAMPSSMKPP